MNPVCVRCKKEMEKLKSGIIISNHPSDSIMPTVVRGDLSECRKCGAMVYSGFGARHSMENKDKIVWIDQE
jgi:uncharacterized protein with PIN domain